MKSEFKLGELWSKTNLLKWQKKTFFFCKKNVKNMYKYNFPDFLDCLKFFGIFYIFPIFFNGYFLIFFKEFFFGGGG